MRWLAIAPVIGLMSLCVAPGLADVLGLGDVLLNKVEQTYGASAKRRVEAWTDLVRRVVVIGPDDETFDDVEGFYDPVFHGPLAISPIVDDDLTSRPAASPELEKLDRVNSFFNRMHFVSDRQHWGREDYWATPVEFLATGAGDCEDFSLAKYFTLKALGIPLERMRLTYAKALELDQAHMVVAYFPTPDAEPLILDNLVDDIRPASQRNDLVPVYSFNGDGLWLSKERGRGRRVGSAGRLKLWNDLRSRMEAMFMTPHRGQRTDYAGS